MSEFNDYIEVSARTEEDALTEAAIKLETTSDKLEYEVIDKGSSGFLGFIGSKPVVIRVRKKAETPVSSDVQEDVSLEERSEAPAEKKITEEQAPSSDAPAESFTEKILAEEEPVNDEELIEAARDFTSRIFQAMGEEVNTTISMDDEEKTMDKHRTFLTYVGKETAENNGMNNRTGGRDSYQKDKQEEQQKKGQQPAPQQPAPATQQPAPTK